MYSGNQQNCERNKKYNNMDSAVCRFLNRQKGIHMLFHPTNFTCLKLVIFYHSDRSICLVWEIQM